MSDLFKEEFIKKHDLQGVAMVFRFSRARSSAQIVIQWLENLSIFQFSSIEPGDGRWRVVQENFQASRARGRVWLLSSIFQNIHNVVHF